ncbi:alpha/beta fold hydrolase [Mucilaginibacter calamicampi]|uniref:Alpha/beta fold hydrolase n=1 Tax=Mucilaginibacter calamicampi TaxID=1302352 RepID=A0ABW2Z5B1_9SPHI
MRSVFQIFTLLLLSGFVLSSCNEPENKQGATQAATPIVVNNSGINIAYTDTGRSDTTLLFIHGWAINKSYWNNQVAYFSKPYRVVTMDLPGFGQSGKNRDKWDTKTYAGDVNKLIGDLGLKKVILVGHSMSGDIALEAAAENPGPIIALVGVDNFKNVGQPQNPNAAKEYAAAVAEMKRNFKKVAFQYMNQSLFSKTTTPDIKNRILNDVAKTDSVIAIASMEQQDPGFDEITALKKAGKKLYLINSDVTPTITKYIAARNIPFQVYYTKGTGHYAMIENPDEFNKLLDEVIEDMKKYK